MRINRLLVAFRGFTSSYFLGDSRSYVVEKENEMTVRITRNTLVNKALFIKEKVELLN